MVQMPYTDACMRGAEGLSDQVSQLAVVMHAMHAELLANLTHGGDQNHGTHSHGHGHSHKVAPRHPSPRPAKGGILRLEGPGLSHMLATAGCGRPTRDPPLPRA